MAKGLDFIDNFGKVHDDARRHACIIDGGILMVSTAKVSKYLKGMHFPADKQRVVNFAREHNAPDDVVNALKSMPDSEFDSMAGVWHAVAKH